MRKTHSLLAIMAHFFLSSVHCIRSDKIICLYISILQLNLPSNLFGLIDLTYIEEKYSGLSALDLFNVLSSLRSHKGHSHSHRHSDTKIWVPSNPRGAERLPADIVASESDLYPRRLWGLPREDLIIKPRYLVCFTVGYEQK